MKIKFGYIGFLAIFALALLGCAGTAYAQTSGRSTGGYAKIAAGIGFSGIAWPS